VCYSIKVLSRTPKSTILVSGTYSVHLPGRFKRGVVLKLETAIHCNFNPDPSPSKKARYMEEEGEHLSVWKCTVYLPRF